MHRHNKLREDQKVCQHLYQQAFEQFHADSGTQYPCSQSDINFHHRERFPHPNKGPFVSAIEATSEIIRHNKEASKIQLHELAAIDRLIDAILDAEDNGYGPDIIIKAFADLDLVFFNGRLRGNACVQWASDEYFQKWQVPPGTWGFTVRPKRGEMGQCRIYLNAKTILLYPSTETPRSRQCLEHCSMKCVMHTNMFDVCQKSATKEMDMISISGPRSMLCTDELTMF